MEHCTWPCFISSLLSTMALMVQACWWWLIWVYKICFHKYHFSEYKSATLASTSQPTPALQLAAPNSFLVSIAHWSSMVTVAAPKPVSEFDWFAIYEYGKDEYIALEHPFLRWKVNNLVLNSNECSSLLLQAHLHEFPVIVHMAHAIPRTMVSVECLFSKSWCICTDQHSSLKAATLTQAIYTEEWL